jgi:hypothetical protein
VQRIILVEFVCTIAFLTGSALAADPETVPLPRERPPVLEDQTSAPKIESERSSCQLQLSEIAEFKTMPPITGPGECTATDVVNVTAVRLPDNHRVMFSSVVTLQCSMAEAVAHWIRDDVAPTISALGTSLRGVETLDSFDCRSFNGISGAHLSEHGHANALDIRSLKLANGAGIELTNATVGKGLREQLRQTACSRFSTVLGNGADAHHESHVHIDLMQRSNNYRICQWDVLDATETAALAGKKVAAVATPTPAAIVQSNEVPVPRPRAVYAEEQQEQTVTVGPWTIGTSFKAGKFDSCSMSRSTEGIDITFLRTPDGLLLLLQSPKWKLERGKAYTIRLMAGSRSVEAKALAESKAVTIVLADQAINERLRTADVLEVRGEGATLRVLLDGSTAALARLDGCFEKNSRAGVDTNPFVSPSRKP